MGSGLADVLIIGVIVFGVVATAKIISDNLTRRRLFASHLPDEAIRRYLSWRPASMRDSSLRWGLVWVGIGLALILIDLVPIDHSRPAAYGLIFVFAFSIV